MSALALPPIGASRKRSIGPKMLIWVVYGAIGALCVGYFASLVLRPGDPYWAWLDGWVVDAIELAASGLCLAKGVAQRQGRGVALTLGASLIAWSLGDVVITVQSLGGATPSDLSIANAFYLLFYPLAYVALVLFMRGEIRRLTTPSWMDGLIAGLGAAAVCAAFAFHRIVHLADLSPAATAINLAYPVGDLLLLGLLVGGTALLAGGQKASWALLAAGILVNVIGDSFTLIPQTASPGAIINSMAWPVSILLMSMSVWARRGLSNPMAPRRETGFVLPQVAAVGALAILFLGSLHHINHVAIGLATLTLLTVGFRLSRSVRGIRTLSQERHFLSLTDELTGLGNRRYLFHVLDTFFAGVAESGMAGRSLAFLFLDLDDFKVVNDSFGHSSGDELLRQLGPRLTASLRSSDLLVRIGGDEFAVVLIDADVDYATTVAQRLTTSLREPFTLGAVSARVNGSIGIAIAPSHGTDSTSLMLSADIAMYRAKAGACRYVIYERERDGADSRLRSVEELRAAIDMGHLTLHYQPQLDLRTGEIGGVEALVRWAHPELGMILPEKFIPLAEEGGLIGSVTAFVLEEALAQCAAWRIAGRRLVVSVNVSATNLLDAGFTEQIRSLLGRYNLPADVLVVEITETCIISEFERSRMVIDDLRDLGVVVSIDDFGAGFTSLAHLGSLAVGELKLDRIFVAGLAEQGKRDSDLVQATINLAHAMGLRVVAEGIEDLPTLGLLTAFGCDIAQGYFISRPQSADAVVAWLHDRADSAHGLHALTQALPS